MKKRAGSAMIASLMVVTALVGIVAAFAASQRAYIRSVQADLDRQRALVVAEAAIQSSLPDLALADENLVDLNDDWALLGEASGQNFIIGSGSARLQIIDEGAFVNLNTATEDQLLNLGLTTEQVESLLDWREAGTTPRPEGAKDEYYNSLQTPYNAALRTLRTIDELLLIKGFTPRTLYELPEEGQNTQPLVQGSDQEQPILMNLATVWSRAPWTRADGSARINANTATAQQLVQAGIQQPLANAIIQRRNTFGTFTSLGQVLTVNGVTLQNAPTILNNLSIDASTEVTGRLNLNTAGEAVLNSLPNSTPDITSAILTRQSQGFSSLGDLASVPGISLQWLQQNADAFVVGSRAFRVRVAARYNSAIVGIEATVVLDGGEPRVTGMYRLPFTDLAARWGWESSTTADIVIAEDN